MKVSNGGREREGVVINLCSTEFVESTANANPNYNDRSAQRRIKVGSSTDKEKTEVACVNT